jgi:Tfp pilus assembly protein PilN
MIRINLLGQVRPKSTSSGIPLESTVRIFLIVGAIGLALVILFVRYYQMDRDLNNTNREIAELTQKKIRLQQVQQQVQQYEQQMAVLQQRIQVIEDLQRNRTGGQELLQMVANTVVRTDGVWLTNLSRKANALEIVGQASSIASVANFITQLKRSGYFQKVEIKEAKENDINKVTETFQFSMTADFVLPQSTPASATPAAPARPGKTQGD